MEHKTDFNVGLIGVGLNTYWAQFEGLHERLLGYQQTIRERMEAYSVNVIDGGLLDSPQNVRHAADEMTNKNIEILFVYISTYALSSLILPLAQQCKVPVIFLNVQPVAAIDYKYFNSLPGRKEMTGEWLAHCQACSAPEFAAVLNRTDVMYDIVTGYLDDSIVWNEIEAWIDAARVKKGMRENRMGILGHYYDGMLDVYTDTTLQSITFGTHIEQLEMCELSHFYDNVTAEDLAKKRKEFEETFHVAEDCEEYELDRAARTSVALDRLVESHDLGSMAYYYEGRNGSTYENLITSVIVGNTLLTGKGVPVAGECEVKNVQAMKIMSLLGAGGSFSELYTADFNDDVVLWGHDGPAHFAMSDDAVQLVPLPVYHGKPGKGLSIQMTVKPGDVTLLSVCEGRDGVFLLVAEAEAVEGPVLNIGNTNSRYRFSCGARAFINAWSKAGPSHHCAIGRGHVAHKLEKVASLLNIPIVKVC